MACESCSLSHAVAERLDVWRAAYAALHTQERPWPEGYGVDPADVLALAAFLSGELGGVMS